MFFTECVVLINSFEKIWFSISCSIFVSVKWQKHVTIAIVKSQTKITFTVFFWLLQLQTQVCCYVNSHLEQHLVINLDIGQLRSVTTQNKILANMHPFSPKTSGEQRLHFIAHRTPCSCGMQRPMPNEKYSPFCSLG